MSNRIGDDGCRAAWATKPKGRGSKPKDAKLPKARVIKMLDGCKVTVEHRKGITPRAILAALEDAVSRVRAEFDADGQVAA